MYSLEVVPIRQDNSLSSNSISTFVQDSLGFMWIGTDNSLERFDGYQSYKQSIYQEQNIHFTDKVETLYKDKKERIWIASTDGVFLFDGFSNKTRKILDTHVFSFLEDDILNGLWLVSSSGLLLINEDGDIKLRITKDDGLSSNQVSSVAKDKDNDIWVSTEKGIDLLRLNVEGDFQILPVVKNVHVSFLLIDSFDYLWYSSREFLYTVNAENFKSNKESPSPLLQNVDISTIYSIGNEVWVGTKGNGIIRFLIHSNRNITKEILWVDKDNENELKNSITVFYEDNYSNIWVGTKDGMYMILRKKFSPFNQIKKDSRTLQIPSHNTISGLTTDSKNRLWMATSKGLDCFKWSDRLNDEYEISHFQDKSDVKNIVSNNKIQSVVLADDNTLLLSTKNHLKFFDLNKSQFYTDNSLSEVLSNHQLRFVRSFYKDKKRNIYMAFASGNLAMYNPYTKAIVPILIGNSDSWGIAEDQWGAIWVASGKDGVIKLVLKDKQNDNWDITPYSQSLFGNSYAVSILCDHNNLIWIGTSEGLYLRNLDNEIVPYALPYQDNNYIEAIVEDMHHNIWVFGIKGIYKIGAARNPELVEYYEFDEDIARQFYVFGRTMSRDGWIFSGGTNGLMYFNPIMVNPVSYNNIPIISSFKILNKDASTMKNREFENISTTKSIRLNHDDYQFSFNVSSLYYPNPYKIKYAYKLEGFDKEWNFLSPNDKTIIFTNIQSGDYVLKIKATDTSGLWSGLPRELQITINPPWWNTWWSRMIYITIFIFIIYLAAKYIIANYKFHHQEEINQWKIRFFINLSYGFITPLNMLQAPIRNMIDNFDNLPGDEMKNMLATAYKNTRRLQHLVSQLVEFRKVDLDKSQLNLSKIDIIAFIQNIYDTFEEVASTKNIRFVFDTALQSEKVLCDPEKIEIVIFNLLSNAFKFTPSGGEIIIKSTLDKRKNRIYISISDTGRGIAEKELPFIFERFRNRSNHDPLSGQGIGLSLAKDFVEMHHSSLSVTSKEGKGSCFEFFILLDDSHFKKMDVKNKLGVEPLYSKQHLELIEPEYYNQKEENTNLPLIYMLEINKEFSSFIKYSLRNSFQIKIFTDIKSIRSAIASVLPSLIILDVISAEQQDVSIVLCSEIKSMSPTAHVPLILTFTVSELDIELLAYEAGADAYIIKPYDVSYLEVRIKQLLQSREKIKERVKQELIVNPKEVKITSADDVFLANLMNKLEENLSDETLSIDSLAESLNISRSALYRRINNISGLSPSDFIKNIRLKRAAQLLETASFTVAEVSYKVGFQDTRYFSTCFKKQYGISPKAYAMKKAKKS